MKKALLALLVLVLASLACSFTDLGTSAEPADPNLLFKDDFSSTFSGWDKTTFDDGSMTDYADNGYRMYIPVEDMTVWANPSLTFDGDVIVSVDATRTAGPDDAYFGVICRYTESDVAASFYFFIVGSDGYATIVKSQDNDFITLLDEWTYSDAINQGGAANAIRAECVGNKLTLFVNGSEVISTTDDAFTKGDVGLVAGTLEVGGTDVMFDNFLVTKP